MYPTVKFLIKIKMLELKTCSLVSTWHSIVVHSVVLFLSFFHVSLCFVFSVSVDDIFRQRKQRHVCKMLS